MGGGTPEREDKMIDSDIDKTAIEWSKQFKGVEYIEHIALCGNKRLKFNVKGSKKGALFVLITLNEWTDIIYKHKTYSEALWMCLEIKARCLIERFQKDGVQ